MKSFFTKLKDFFDDIKARLGNSKGYVMILVVAALPVLLLGIKYAIQLKQKSTAEIYKVSDNEVFLKKCAKEAALEVAKHWNPALTLKQQFGALIRKVDAVYNASPTHHKGIMGEAIGADNVGVSSSPSTKQIIRTYPSYPRNIFESSGITPFLGLPLYDVYCGIYDLVSNSECVLHNFEKSESISLVPIGKYSKVQVSINDNIPQTRTLRMIATSGSAAIPGENTDCVDIAVEGNSLKVRTDDDIGYAVPAECNVDIVLSIPVNMAANNQNNRDTSSLVSEEAYYSDATTLNDTAKSTPIYQIREAYKEFLRKFMFTRGINVGLIPYCGNISIPISRVNDWTMPLPEFKEEYFQQSPFIRSAFLYSTLSGLGDNIASADFVNHYGRTANSLTAIRCRAGEMTTESAYGNNVLMKGDILSNAAPTTNALKFVRHWFKPCYLGNANLLDMKCKKTTLFGFNPYHIVELTPDLNKIYNLLNVIVPYHCEIKNVSNFVFLPITWANNLFQNWTAGTETVYDVDTDDDGTNLGRLSVPAKSENKKAVILIVNKPDFFEQGELTYLGFNNDYSEIPMIESDFIDFSANYLGNASYKYPDGTSFDGTTIQGGSKILKYTTQSGTAAYNENAGYYEATGTATGRLSFPVKGLVKIVVEPRQTQQNSGLHKITEATEFVFSGANLPAEQWSDFMWETGVSVSSTGGVNFGHNLSVYKLKYLLDNATITNCVLKQQVLREYTGFYIEPPAGRKRLILNTGEVSLWYGEMTEEVRASFDFSWDKYKDICIQTTGGKRGSLNSWRGGIGYLLSNPFYMDVYGISAGGKIVASLYTWEMTKNFDLKTSDSTYENIFSDTLYGIKHVSFGASCYTDKTCFKISASNDGSEWYAPLRYYYILNDTDKGFKADITDEDLLYNRYVGLKKIDGKDWIVFQGDGELHVTVTPNSGGGAVHFYDDNRAENEDVFIRQFQFTNVSGESEAHSINKRTEFYIELSQISNNKDGNGNYYIDFNMENIQLVSAEITNRGYSATALPTSATVTSTSASFAKPPVDDYYLKLKVKAKDFINWVSLGILPYKFEDSCYGEVQYVMINSDGYVAISSDSLTWTYPNRALYDATSEVGWNCICSIDGGYVAINSKGYVIKGSRTVTGGVAWTSTGRPLYDATGVTGWRGMCKKDGLLWAMSENGHMATSKDGFTWSSLGNGLASVKNSGWYNICYGSGKYVAIGYYKMATSTDAITWTDITPPSSGCYGICYGLGYYWALHWCGTLYQSSDLINWTSTNPPLGSVTNWRTIRFLNNRFIAVQNYSGYVATGSQYSSVTIGSKTFSFLNETELIIQKSDITISGNTCSVNHTLNNATVVSAEIIYGKDYYLNGIKNSIAKDTKPRLPDSETTRVMDFSQDGVYHSPSSVYVGYNQTRFPDAAYNAELGYYVTYDTDGDGMSINHECYNGYTPGDYFFLIENVGTVETKMRLFGSSGPETYSGVKCRTYNLNGLSRGYQTFPDIRTPDYASFDILGADAKVKLIFEGFTFPVNTALYYGGYYQNSGAMDYVPHNAAARATVEACAKLKSDIGSNGRIYVIKYRKQANYKHPTSGNAVTFDYSYINNCASGSSYVYDVSDKAGLDAALEAIANNIKTFGGYKSAKNIAAPQMAPADCR